MQPLTNYKFNFLFILHLLTRPYITKKSQKIITTIITYKFVKVCIILNVSHNFIFSIVIKAPIFIGLEKFQLSKINKFFLFL